MATATDVVRAREEAELLETLALAIEANLLTPRRSGSVVELCPETADDVVVSADLHGHRENFAHVLALADLDAHPRRHLILQEVCHGGPAYENLACQSHEMLAEVAALKVAYPDRVHFLLSNHELAELTGYPIRKEGKILSLSFLMGIHQLYGTRSEAIHSAYMAFVASCPLAVRIGPDVFVSHSAPEKIGDLGFDASVLTRPLTAEDFSPEGSAFRMVWGRDYRPENAKAFAEAVGAQVLVHGHTPCPNGYHAPNEYQLILDCCATPAACAVVPVRAGLTHADVVASVCPLPTSSV
jgi:hypothetical protein